MFDPGSFGIAGARGVDEITEKSDALGLEFFAQGEKFFASSLIS